MKKTGKNECECEGHRHFLCCGHRKRFPTIIVLLALLAVLWLLSDMGILTVNVPWIPLALLVICIGWLINHYTPEE